MEVIFISRWNVDIPNKCFFPYLESKGMHAIFQKKGKKGKKMFKKGKIFENLGQNVQNLKIFWKRAGYYMQLLLALNC